MSMNGHETSRQHNRRVRCHCKHLFVKGLTTIVSIVWPAVDSFLSEWVTSLLHCFHIKTLTVVFNKLNKSPELSSDGIRKDSLEDIVVNKPQGTVVSSKHAMLKQMFAMKVVSSEKIFLLFSYCVTYLWAI